MNKTIKWIKQHKKPIILFTTVGLATLAISLLMWRLLDYNHKQSSKSLIEENINSSQQTTKLYDWIYDEPQKNYDIFLKKKDKFPFINFDEKISDMDVFSILYLNGVFFDITQRIISFSQTGEPYFISYQKGLEQLISRAQQIADSYTKIHEDTFKVIIELDENNKIHITQEFNDILNLEPLHWTWTPHVDKDRISQIYNLN